MLVPEVLRPCLVLFRGFANSTTKQCQGLPKAVWVKVGEARRRAIGDGGDPDLDGPERTHEVGGVDVLQSVGRPKLTLDDPKIFAERGIRNDIA